MALVNARESFVKYSGRYDLVVDTDDWEDNGADYFINAGQKWLDTTFTFARTRATYFQSIGVGGWYAIIPSCRVVHALWVSNASKGRWQVERKSLSGFRQLFPGALTEITQGRTEFYAPLHLRNVPEILATITLDQLGQTAYTVAGEVYSYNGVLFAPPTEEAITLEVDGTFYQPPLVDDEDINYWTEELEHVLVMSACRQIEISYRNTVGVKDWESSIRDEVSGLEMDLADSESAGIKSMEG